MRSTEDSTRRLRGGSVRGGDVTALREELKKKDEELLASMERISTLERALERKDEEIELSRGVEA